MSKFSERAKTAAKKFVKPSYLKGLLVGYFGISRGLMYGPEVEAVVLPATYLMTGAVEAAMYVAGELAGDYDARHAKKAAEKSA